MFESTVVTGAAGFIGSHLTRRLLAEGCPKLSAIDSLEFGAWANLGPDEARVRCITSDLVDLSFDAMREALEGTEVLFHLAAQKHNNKVDSAERVLGANVVATERLFRAAAAAQVRRIVFTSSLYAHGRLSDPPMAEDQATFPSNTYGVSKLAGEGLLRTVGRDTGIEGVSLRFFFIYGPRQYVGLGYPSVIVRTFDRILRGQAPTQYGDGQQSLDYVYVDDAIEAVLAAARTPHLGEVFNVASGIGVKVADLLRLLSDVAGYSGDPELMPRDWTADTHRIGDPTKARELLGWSSTTPLEVGLTRTLQWMRENR